MAVVGARGRCRRPASSFFNGPDNVLRPSTAHTKWRRICAQQPRSKFARHASHAPRPRGGNRTLRRSEICSRGREDIVKRGTRASDCNWIGLGGCARPVGRPGAALRSISTRWQCHFDDGLAGWIDGLAVWRVPVSARYQPKKPSSAPLPSIAKHPIAGKFPRSKHEPPPAPNHQYRRLQKPR